MAAAKTLTPQQRSDRARKAAVTRWSKTDPQERLIESAVKAVRRTLADAAPLSAETAARIRDLLAGGDDT